MNEQVLGKDNETIKNESIAELCWYNYQVYTVITIKLKESQS